MDYHFVFSEDQPKSTKKRSSFLKSFLPVFVVSGLLPFLLFFTLTPPEWNFLPRADEPNSLRVWFDPTSVVMDSQGTFEVNVMASFDDPGEQLFSLKLNFPQSDLYQLDKSSLTLASPFTGQTTLGTIKVTPKTSQSFQISLSPSNIETDKSDLVFSSSPLEVAGLNP